MTKTQYDETGNYASPPLRPGNYRVIAGAPGFKTQTRSEITLKVQDRLRLDFDMTVGAVSEIAEVTAETPTIQTDTSSLGQVVMGTQNGTAAEWTRLYPACDVEYGSGPHQFRDNGNSGGSSTGGQ